MASDNGLTLTTIGCGTMGIAILGGIMDSLNSASKSSEKEENLPPRLPTRFLATCRSDRSASRIKNELGKYEANLDVIQSDNVRAMKEADVVLLACKPFYVKDVLEAEGVREALEGKLLISILAGVPEAQLEGLLYPDLSHEEVREKITIVRTMPNTASKVRESMTVINQSTPPLPQDTKNLVHWMMSRIGKVVEIEPKNMDACTALCGSGPAFAALIMEALADGGVAMGIPRAEANLMAAQVMRGTTGLVQDGEHPAILREKVSTPGGCTIGGLLVLEDGAVRSHVSRAVREATVVASLLGSGAKNVNGTRH
ncbi:pyrroline-5-carboxylate reductase [Aureobasidium pullulans]|uniref:Pyrroline-5-carboxylate reductase n=1 Tax=Aureobasidium pullulans TaxID=5580 RepID=A0A4V4JUU8_AURPU|nr:pyrroline-5-carboxylate reductase [Aureobasidium pullulans]THY22913.1 pyrroline-5-carboxylate reductase [Aureobasidium pullulans]